MNDVDPASAGYFVAWFVCVGPLLAMMLFLAPPMGVVCCMIAFVVAINVLLGIPYLWMSLAVLAPFWIPKWWRSLRKKAVK